MKNQFAASALFFCLTAVAHADAVAPPSSQDSALVHAALADRLLDPGSMIVEHVLSAPDPTSRSGITWVCGEVRGKNGFGGYAQPEPFLAMITKELLGPGRVVQFVRIASSRDTEELILRICQQKFSMAIAIDDAGPEFAEEIMSHSDAATACTIEGPSSAACALRDKLATSIKAKGMCVSELGDWVPCGTQ